MIVCCRQKCSYYDVNISNIKRQEYSLQYHLDTLWLRSKPWAFIFIYAFTNYISVFVFVMYVPFTECTKWAVILIIHNVRLTISIWNIIETSGVDWLMTTCNTSSDVSPMYWLSNVQKKYQAIIRMEHFYTFWLVLYALLCIFVRRANWSMSCCLCVCYRNIPSIG